MNSGWKQVMAFGIEDVIFIGGGRITDAEILE